MRRKFKWVIYIIFLVCIYEMAGCAREKEETIELAAAEDEQSKKTNTEENDPVESKSDDTEGQELIYVYVCGQVANPGVYQLSAGRRVFEAIEAAGGMLDTAAAEFVNQAGELTDGEKVYIPDKDEAKALGEAGEPGDDSSGLSEGQADQGKIDLNAATKEQLMTLNGIGESRALDIIEYREEHGGFQSVEEIKEVQGIKEGIYQKIKDNIRI